MKNVFTYADYCQGAETPEEFATPLCSYLQQLTGLDVFTTHNILLEVNPELTEGEEGHVLSADSLFDVVLYMVRECGIR